MEDVDKLKQVILKLHKRNKRVEADKAWETSWPRRILIFVLTYFVVVAFFLVADLPRPFVNSLVPAGAFILSTLTMPIFKTLWLKNRKQ